MKYGKLRKSWQFRKIYKEGDKYFSSLFVLYVLPNGTQEIRLGLTVTKKVGISVQRNRIKRVVREVVRSLEEIAPGNDLVVVARRAAVDLKSSIKILTASAIAAIPTYLTATQLLLPNWLILILGATIYLITYMITAPLMGAINQQDIQNLKEMLTSLGPLAPILTLPLNSIEHLITKFQKN